MALRILLADGNITNQNAGRKVLAAADHDLITVSNGLAVIRKLAEAELDLLLLDVDLPGYGGIEICKKVKTTPEMAHIAVLLSVSKLEAFRTAECIKAKADGFILKPFEAGELVVTVDKLGERVHPMNTSISRALAVPKLGIVPHCSSGENVDHIKRVGHDGFLQQERGEVCDVCGYVNQGHAFVCQQCDVPLPGSVSQSSVSFRSR